MKKESDNEFIFTFGFAQVHSNKFVAISSDNSNTARDVMVDKFGTLWSMQYEPPNARKKAGVEQFNLQEIK